MRIGERVAVFGIGATGQMIVQMARSSGAQRVVAVDPVPNRRALARRMGAHLALDPAACDAGQENERWSGEQWELDLREWAEARFRVAVGRVYLHSTHGHEGGDKMILPAVSAFATIVRDHSMIFAPRSNYGIIEGNWSRKETDNFGEEVWLDFVLKFVMNRRAGPVWAYGWEPMTVHLGAVAFGERHVSGAGIGGLAHVTIAAPGPEGAVGLDTQVLTMAMAATCPGGTIVLLARDEENPAREERKNDLRG